MRSSIFTRATLGALPLVIGAAALAGNANHPAGAAHALQTNPATAHRMQPTTLGPARTGQPNKSCETTPNTPGNSATAPGSAFNPDGKAGTVYAGEQPQNSRNTASVSQYDVACARPR